MSLWLLLQRLCLTRLIHDCFLSWDRVFRLDGNYWGISRLRSYLPSSLVVWVIELHEWLYSTFVPPVSHSSPLTRTTASFRLLFCSPSHMCMCDPDAWLVIESSICHSSPAAGRFHPFLFFFLSCFRFHFRHLQILVLARCCSSYCISERLSPPGKWGKGSFFQTLFDL